MDDLTVNALVRDFGSSSWSPEQPVTFTRDKKLKYGGEEFQMLRRLDSGEYAGTKGDKSQLQYFCRMQKLSYYVNPNLKQNRIDIVVAPETRMDDAEDLDTKGLPIGFSFLTLDDYQKVYRFLNEINVPEVYISFLNECNNKTAGLTKEKYLEMQPTPRQYKYTGPPRGGKKRKSYKKGKPLKKRKSLKNLLIFPLNVGLGYTSIIPANCFFAAPRAYLSFSAVIS